MSAVLYRSAVHQAQLKLSEAKSEVKNISNRDELKLMDVGDTKFI